MPTESDKDSIQIQLGQAKIKLLQFSKSKASGDVYAKFGIPAVGLHYSFHHPRPPLYPSAHLHLKSVPLDLHEDILDFDLEDLEDRFLGFAEEFINNISEPAPDKSVTLLPISTHALSSGNINVGNLIKSMTGIYYRTKTNRLIKLIEEKPYLEGTLGLSDDSIIMPFDKEAIFEIPFEPNFEVFNRLFSNSPINSLIDPLSRAFESIQQNSPDSFRKWIPPSSIESFVQETQSIVKRAKAQIIDY
jgi:hypothetical protein